MSRKAAPREYKRRSKGKGFAVGPRLEFRAEYPLFRDSKALQACEEWQ